jgi:hypothetical protein
VGQAADQARQERELSKQAFAERVEHFEKRVREELDWRTRLRRNRGPVLAIGAGAVVLLAALIVLRSRLGDRGRGEEPATLDDVTNELHEIRRQLERRGGESPLWQRLVLRSAVAAASAGGAYAAKRLVQPAEAKQEGPEAARAR